MQKSSALFRSFRKGRDGSSAVEFAIAAPMLIISLITVTDIGLAMQQRMNLDQSVRAGAEFAMNNVSDVETIKEMVKSAATGSYGQARNDVTSNTPTVTVPAAYCECPDARGTAVACDTLCTGDVPPSIFYDITATRRYDAIFIPDFTLASQMTVQVR
jgi:Flp pilus assembly protein TadG